LVIENLPSLTAFGWSESPQHAHELYILGGSNGRELQSSLYKVDLKERKCTDLDAEFQVTTAFINIAAICDKTATKIFTFGGSNTSDSVYSINLKDEKPQW
jgi:hypothetical protein